MSTTLNNLIPRLYENLDIVSREMVGFIPAVTRDTGAERAALNQTITLPIAPAAAATDITPGVTPPNDGNQTIGETNITITKARRVPFRWTGEQTRGANAGVGAGNIQDLQIQQALRTLVNEIEADLAALHITASRAAGAAGTTPFGSNLNDANAVRQILVDNGAPQSDLQLVLGTTAGTNLRNLANLTRVNEAGGDDLLRQGILLPLSGMAVRESAATPTFTKGTGASATTNNAGYAIGATVITLASAGTGTILAGDVITFAGDANQYVVLSGDTDVSNGGTFTLAAPGLRRAIAASNTNITVVNNAARNMAFARTALVLVARQPALPDGGDLARDRVAITDPRSGLVFELAMYPQYRQMQWELSLAWGVQNIKPEHTALLLG